MHNLHIVRVKAESHETALENADEIVSDGYPSSETYDYIGSYCREDQTFSERFSERWFEKNEFLNNPQLFQDMLKPDEIEISGQKVFENGVQYAKGDDLLKLSYYFRKKYERSKLSTQFSQIIFLSIIFYHYNMNPNIFLFHQDLLFYLYRLVQHIHWHKHLGKL